MKNLRNSSQISRLGRELFPKNPQMLLESFQDSMKVPYGYLVVDISPQFNRDDLRLRSNIFPGEDMIVYKPVQ